MNESSARSIFSSLESFFVCICICICNFTTWWKSPILLLSSSLLISLNNIDSVTLNVSCQTIFLGSFCIFVVASFFVFSNMIGIFINLLILCISGWSRISLLSLHLHLHLWVSNSENISRPLLFSVSYVFLLPKATSLLCCSVLSLQYCLTMIFQIFWPNWLLMYLM